MGLQVWLPLTKDLRQQGIHGSTITGNNITYTTGGKMGGCYQFNGTSSYLISNSSPFSNNTDNWSYTCWFKPNNQHNGCLFSCRTGTNSTGMTIFYYTDQILFDDGVRWQFTPSTAIATGTWNHLTFVRKKGVGKYCYLNGILVGSTTTTGTQTTVGTAYAIGGSQSSNTAVSVNWLNGYLNDVRIYDHALSQLEIKQLSQGLILHYPLNRRGLGNENLLSNTNIEKTGNSATAQWFRWDVVNPMLETGTTYTLSFDAKMTVTTDVFYISWSNADSTQEIINQGTQVTTEYKRYSFTGQTTKTNINAILISNYKGYNRGNNNNTTGVLSVRNIKLELGDKATPYCPNSTDTLYSSMNLNSNIEYDGSGFQYNGTKTGTFNWSNDTPNLYDVSTDFNTNNYITINPLVIDMNNLTFSLWVKWDAFNSYSRIWDFGYAASGGGYCCFLMNDATNGSIKLRLRNSSGTEVLNKTFITASLNTWYHIAFTLSGTTCKIYVNGDLNSTSTLSSNIGIATFNYPYIGKSNWSTDALLNGKLSDFRIYTTTLSDKDIKSLYQNSAYIDDNNVIYGKIR